MSAEMSLKMTLSLIDAATPALTAFINKIEQLGPKVTGLANRFSTLERNIDKVGQTAQNSSAKVDKFGSSITKLDASSASLESVMGKLPGVVLVLTSALQAAASAVNAAAGTFNALSSASKAASGNVAEATTTLHNMGNVVNSVTKQVTTLHGVMEGLAAQWASMKIFEAGGAVVNEASQMQLAQMKLSSMNIKNGSGIEADSALVAKQLGLSVREGLEVYMSAIAGLAVTDYSESKKVIQATLDEAVKTAILLRLRGDTSSVGDLTRNIYGLVEARGQAFDTEAAIRTMSLIQKFNTADAQKLSTKDMETISRQLKDGLGVFISDLGLLQVLAYGEQLKASGHGGGGGGMGVSQAGTMATQVAKWGTVGVQNKENIRTLIAMGMVDPTMVRMDSLGVTENLSASAIKGSEKAKEAPLQFLMDMAPKALALAMKNPDIYAKGLDLNTLEGVKSALVNVAMTLSHNISVAQGMATAWLPGSSERLNAKVEQTMNSKDTGPAIDDANKTYTRNVEKFSAAVKTLENSLGDKLLPILTPIVEKLTELMGFFSDVANAHPTVTVLNEIALGLGAIGLAVFGLQKMFGIFTMIGGFLKGLGGAMKVTAEGANLAVPALKLFGVEMKLVGFTMKGAMGWVGLLWLLYDVLVVVFDYKIWGVSIGTWFSSWVDGAFKSISNLYISIKEFLGLLSEAEAKAQKQKNRDDAANAQVANGISPSGGNLSGRKIAWGPSAGKSIPTTADGRVINSDGTYSAAGTIPTPVKERNREAEALQRLLDKSKEELKNTKKIQRLEKGFNMGAEEQKQEYKQAEQELSLHIRALDRLKKVDEISDEDYYTTKLEYISTYYGKMETALEKEIKKLSRPQDAHKKLDVEYELKNVKANEQDARDAVSFQRKQDALKYEYDMKQAISVMDEVEGKKAEGRFEKLKERLVGYKKEADKHGDTSKSEQLSKGITEAESGIKYENEYLKYTAINDRVIQQNAIIDAQLQAGIITEQDAAHQKYELHKQEAAQLQEILDKLERLANDKHDQALVDKIALLKIQMQGFAQALSPEALKVKGVLENSFGTFASDIMTKNKSLKASFTDLFKSIYTGILDLMAKNISQQLYSSIFGSRAGSGVLGAIGGVTAFQPGAMGGLWSSLFGSSGSASTPAFDSLQNFAVGTNAVPFDMIAKIHKDEIIVPAANRDQAISLWNQGAGGGGVNVTNHFVIPAPTDNRTQNQIATLAASALRNAQRNM